MHRQKSNALKRSELERQALELKQQQRRKMLDCKEDLRCIELEDDAKDDYTPTVKNPLVNKDRTKPVAYSRHMNMKESISDDRSTTS